jgi:ribosomal protein S18 acetylase RimI-like enzyme
LRKRGFFGRDFIELLAVKSSERRQGLGSALVADALQHPGTNRVFTSTNRSNQAMRKLLEDAAWSFSGQLDGIDQGDPELIFWHDR